jgi:hypothetical protein
MAKKNVSKIERGAGLSEGIISNLMELAREKGVPCEAFSRLAKDESRATLAKIVDLVYVDWQAKRPLVDGEYRVQVSYTMPRDKATLEAEFSKDGVHEVFYGDGEWRFHPWDTMIDQHSGERVMLVKRFEHATNEQFNETIKQGYRPATHLEAYAFAKANPDVQCGCGSILAMGSSVTVCPPGYGRFGTSSLHIAMQHYYAMLDCNRGRRTLGAIKCDMPFLFRRRFCALFVRG